MSKTYKLTLLLLLIVSSFTFAQKTYKVFGKVTSEQTGEDLIGANVYVKGLAIGAATDANGHYEFNLPKGSYTIICSYIGFEAAQITNINVTNNMELNFALKDYEFSLNVEVIADRAKEQETPVAFTNIEKKDVEFKLGSQDIPMVLNTTPSVYATEQGGGSGDARINVRGFDQRNVAIMINGVPVNDMENGWVYWSNWDGVGDATSSIQIQRGLSAVNLATPSIGGTMNIITDPTAANFGAKLKQEFGNDSFFKTTLALNSGLINDKFALSAVIVKKTGNGLIDKTWTNAWAYYFGASYNINDKNRIELYGLGAPQRHGQNLYKQNAAVYNKDFAKDLGFSQEALDYFAEKGRTFNQNWAPVSSSYKGKQWATGVLSSQGSEIDRYDENFINERENFFHKPIFNLNWYSILSKKLSLYTTAYWSGGHGGGTGTIGKLTRVPAVAGNKWYKSPPWAWDWDATIAANRNNTDSLGNNLGSKGVIRNSRNDQYTIGLISKAYYKVSDNFKTSFGVDWRTAEIDHYREVRDLLGGSYFLDNSDQFNPNKHAKLGDKIAYYNTNTVDWFGFYGQGEYTKDKITAYAMGGWSMIKYTFTDHFKKGTDGGELTATPDAISGFQVKGGASFRISPNLNVFANGGFVSKVPIFDAVINDRDGSIVTSPKNEKFVNIEAGINSHMLDGKLNVKANVYYTTWKDRSNRRSVLNEDGSEGIINLTGMDSRHMGFELETAYMPNRLVRFDLSGSIGNWTLTDDVSGRYSTYQNGQPAYEDFNYYVKDLKVGDQPQTAVVFTATLFPVKGLALSGLVKHYRDHYANWNPFDRTDANDRAQSWLTPDYTVVDFHFTYNLPLKLKGVNFQLFGHVFNALDAIYVQDATDNSKYNAYTGNGKTHSADDAEIFLGLPRTFNLGISILL